jgi:glycosyltransferase involved in cell wall biosynthesis
MKRGLVFAKYGTRAASTRQRFVQAEPFLKQAGIEIAIAPLFDNTYLDRLFNGQKQSMGNIAGAYAKRIAKLFSARDYDFIWVHCELFPYLPSFMERLVSISGKPVIYDYDDAIFHQYDQHNNPLIQAILSNKLAPLMRRANLAFCGNAYLRAYADRYCKHTEIIPTTVDITLYQPRSAASSSPLTIGWIGSPSTWRYCAQMADVLSTFAKKENSRVLIIGAQHAADSALPFEFRDWAEEREIADIQEMDIGIMPIPDEPWARGKCGYKLIQYMACGIPVIASPVGVNSEIVEHGVNGFLASTPEEWRAAITQLANDADLRKRMGEAGRARVEAHYSIQQFGPRMAELIHSLA